MTTTTTIEEQVQSAIAFLRQAGREAEARAVSALLDERRPDHRPAPPTQPEELVPIAEAARRLGTSRKGVVRRIESGWLVSAEAPDGVRCVTRESLDRLLDSLRASDVVAAPLGGLTKLNRAGDSQVARMVKASLRQRQRLERAEIEHETREDRERAASGRHVSER